MTREQAPIDISAMPEVAHLVEEAERTRSSLHLKRGNDLVAVLSPAPSRGPRRKGKTVTEADIAAALAASWVGLVDAEQLKRELDEARSDDRPPVNL